MLNPIEPQTTNQTEGIHSLINGITGSGKSYFAKWYIKDYNRILIYDTKGEYTDGIIFNNINELKKFWGKYYYKDFRIIFDPLNHNDFSEVCDLVYTCGDMAFLVEELDLVAGTFDNDVNFQTVLRRGRTKGIDFIGVTQRPYGINRNITSQIKIFYSFKQIEPRDIQYLKLFAGNEAENIKDLNMVEYQFYYRDFTTSEIAIKKLVNNELITIKDLTSSTNI